MQSCKKNEWYTFMEQLYLYQLGPEILRNQAKSAVEPLPNRLRYSCIQDDCQDEHWLLHVIWMSVQLAWVLLSTNRLTFATSVLCLSGSLQSTVRSVTWLQEKTSWGRKTINSTSEPLSWVRPTTKSKDRRRSQRKENSDRKNNSQWTIQWLQPRQKYSW